MKNFKFFDGQKMPEWQGASWFWEGATIEGGLSIDRSNGRWRLEIEYSATGLRGLLLRFNSNMIVPVAGIFYGNRWYKVSNGQPPTFHFGMLDEPVHILYYYDIVGTD